MEVLSVHHVFSQVKIKVDDENKVTVVEFKDPGGIDFYHGFYSIHPSFFIHSSYSYSSCLPHYSHRHYDDGILPASSSVLHHRFSNFQSVSYDEPGDDAYGGCVSEHSQDRSRCSRGSAKGHVRHD